MAFSKNDQSIIDELENYFMSQTTELHDLHTHLLGMGDEKFWIRNILMKETILPTHQAFVDHPNLQTKLCRLVWNPYEGQFLNGVEVESIFQCLITNDYPKTEGKLESLQTLIESIFHRPTGVHTEHQSGSWRRVEETIRSALPASSSIDSNHLNTLMKELKVLIQPELPEQTPVFYSMVEGTNEFKRELENRGLSFKKDFCYDVILKLDDLASGLGVTNQTNQFIQTAVEEKLGFHLRLSNDRPTFRHWIIFNARQQCFEVAYGIRVEDLRKLIRTNSETSELANQIAYGHIVNTISMCDAQGTGARPIDFHSFQGMFTPEFYPRRFALKDSIYSQRLDVLAYLLRHVLHRYDTCHPPVTYCELSIGVGDLTRPWVFDVLCSLSPPTQDSTNASSSFRKLLDQGYFSPYQKDVTNDTTSQQQLTWLAPKCTYKFLAGFNRQHVQTSYFKNQKQAIDLLNEAPQIAIHLMLNEIEKSDRKEYIKEKTDTFYKHKEALDKMKVSIRDQKIFYHWVVGLDLFGDEMGFPYCAFVARDFIQYVKEIRDKFNKSFGLRIHCGENVPFADTTDPAYRHFAAHMYIAFRCLRYLQHELEYGIRVGHGIAFQRILDRTMSSSKHRKSSVLLAEIEHQAPYVFKTIPFEVNITSNEYLLGFALRNGTRQRPLQLDALFDLNVPIILATDNDGIWPITSCPCGQSSHFSLSGECCRAIETGIIKSVKHFEHMFKHMKTYRFCSENTELINTKADISILPHDPRAFTVVIHPDIIKFIIGLCSKPEQKKGKFYDAFKSAYSCDSARPTNQTQLSPEDLQKKKIWEETCRHLARIAYVSYCAR
jgi:adenosine deaminase